MARTESPRDVLNWIRSQPACVLDQWQAQVLATVLIRRRVSVYSSLPPRRVAQCMLTPVADLQAAVDAELAALGPGADVAVLPHGPVTIPFLKA